jgi:hypothetical protein
MKKSLNETENTVYTESVPHRIEQSEKRLIDPNGGRSSTDEDAELQVANNTRAGTTTSFRD